MMNELRMLKWDLSHDRWTAAMTVSVWLFLGWLVLACTFVRFCVKLWQVNRFMFGVTAFNVGVAGYLLTLMVLDYTEWLNQFICN